MDEATRTHWDGLAAFARAEMGAGGPDPHLTLCAEMARKEEFSERVWRGGCYVAFYCAPYAEVLWRVWPWERVREAPPAALEDWLREEWPRLSPGIHRHRKTVRRIDWMLDYLVSYREFVDRLPIVLDRMPWSDSHLYDAVWNRALEVRRLGRYVGLKLMEYLRLVQVVPVPLQDLRPRDAWSPRKSLALLWPEFAIVEERSNAQSFLDLTNHLGERTKDHLEKEHDLELSWFLLQVFLCEYRQALKGRQHPGRANDTELKLARRVEADWTELGTLDVWRARRAILSAYSLGELRGWVTNRNELRSVLPKHGYTWSDLKYDWKETGDLSMPTLHSSPGIPVGYAGARILTNTQFTEISA